MDARDSKGKEEDQIVAPHVNEIIEL